MHKYYEWQLIESLPLTSLGELLSFAHNEEKRLEKHEIEKQLFPLWLANYLIAKLQGVEQVMDFEEFMKITTSPGEAPKPKTQKPKTQKRTAEDIMAEFMPYVEADKQRGG